MSCFWEALTVAPPFLDTCLDIFGAWINQTILLIWDIILENRAFFVKNGFLTQKLFFVMDQTFTINLLSYTKILVPIYRLRAITFFMVPPFFGKKMAFCPKIKKKLSWALFREALIVAPPFLDMCLDIFGAWINPPKHFYWDIIWQNIACFAKKCF